MIKVKTKELTRNALNWAVAKALGRLNNYEQDILSGQRHLHAYGTSDSIANPIIDSENITISFVTDSQWIANKEFDAETRIIAGLRCYVARKLGNEIEIPIAILDRDYREKLNEITPEDVDEMSVEEVYALRVQQLEDEDMTTSDAQSCADVEDTRGTIVDNVKNNLGKFIVRT